MSSRALRPKEQPNDACDRTVGGLAEAAPDGSASLPLDVTFDLLSNERRRMVLRYLVARSEPITLGDLAEHVAGIENDKPEDALTSTERKRVYVALYQCHLPKLDGAGVVDFDEARKTVDVGPNAEQLLPYLRPSSGDASDDDRSVHTVLLGVCAAAVVVASIVPFSTAWLTGLLAGVFLASAVRSVSEFVR